MINLLNTLIALFTDIVFDLTCVLIIITSIKSLNTLTDSQTACQYMSNQFQLMFSSCVGCSITLRSYCAIKSHLQLNDEHDLLLSLFLIIGGWIINAFYQHTHDKKGKYTPTNGEYSTIVIASVIGVGSKMFAEGIIPFSVIFFLIIGRLSGWLDTKSPKELIDDFRTQHKRVNESSVLLMTGMILVSVTLRYSFLNIPSNILQIIGSFTYGLILLLPYYSIKRWLMKRKVGRNQ